jgi:hypothetical protein
MAWRCAPKNNKQQQKKHTQNVTCITYQRIQTSDSPSFSWRCSGCLNNKTKTKNENKKQHAVALRTNESERVVRRHFRVIGAKTSKIHAKKTSQRVIGSKDK